MMQSYPGIDPDMSAWKGREIIEFQEEMLRKVNAQLSEKWFYMHIKATNTKLPRIDVLNLLSRYAGYIDWQDFSYKNGNFNINCIPVSVKSPKRLGILIRIPLIFIIVMTLLLIILKLINTQNYIFTFIDSDTGEPILNNVINAELVLSDQSPASFISDENGNITIRTNKGRISMIVKAHYYLTDTVRKSLRKFKNSEQVSLRPDYYALMIRYFSESDVSSWEKRREKLSEVISEDAIFYQSPGNKNMEAGIAIFNKWEFIDKLTMPSSGLRQIEILDCRYTEGKITVLRFRIRKDSE